MAEPAAASPDKPAAAAFNKKFDQWKTLLKDMRKVKSQYSTAATDEQAKLREQWTALVASGNALLPDLRDAGLAAYKETPNGDPQLTRFLVKLAADNVERDEYEAAEKLTSALIENECDDPAIYDSAGRTAFALNDYAKAEEYFKTAREAGVLSPIGNNWSLAVESQKQLWADEQKLREKEAEDNLPRVKLTTNKGEIVLELFENQAPETVGNFVSLVEKKFYDGLPFHRVLPNFMAQGGDPKGDGTGGPGYEIYDELDTPDYRRHFRGSLSMAHAGKDTGGSQFFLCFVPTPQLNGLHTCFGRVIEGVEVLAQIQRRDPSKGPPLPEPDRIVTAEVLRKRDHAYVPHKVE
jgi:cyclophilin family peptidyl-prolyl cis-trans isomerase